MLIASLSFLVSGCAQMYAAQLTIAAIDALDDALKSSGQTSTKTKPTSTNSSAHTVKPSGVSASALCVLRGTYLERVDEPSCIRLGGVYRPTQSVNIGCKRDGKYFLHYPAYCSASGGVVDNDLPAKCSNNSVISVFNCLQQGFVALSLPSSDKGSSTSYQANNSEPSFVQVCSLSTGDVVRATADECNALGGRIR